MDKIQELFDIATSFNTVGRFDREYITERLVYDMKDGELAHRKSNHRMDQGNPFIDDWIRNTIKDSSPKYYIVMNVRDDKQLKLLRKMVSTHKFNIPTKVLTYDLHRIKRFVKYGVQKKPIVFKPLMKEINGLALHNVYHVVTDQRFLDAMVEYGVEDCILDIVPNNGNFFKTVDFKSFASERFFNGNTFTREMDEERYHTNKPTQVMTKTYANYSGLSLEEAEEYITVRQKEVLDGPYLRINFRLQRSSSDCLPTLMKQFEQNNVVPIRLNWSSPYGTATEKHVIGGNVFCPYEHFDRYMARIKLYGLKKSTVSVNNGLLTKLLIEDYDARTSDITE